MDVDIRLWQLWHVDELLGELRALVWHITDLTAGIGYRHAKEADAIYEQIQKRNQQLRRDLNRMTQDYGHLFAVLTALVHKLGEQELSVEELAAAEKSDANLVLAPDADGGVRLKLGGR